MIQLPETFWSDISHQLRSPFTGLVTVTGFLFHKQKELDRIPEIIKKETDILLRRINLLTLLMQLKDKQIKSLYEFFDFFEIFDEQLKVHFNIHNLKFDNVYILADRGLMEKLLDLMFTDIKSYTNPHTQQELPGIKFRYDKKQILIEVKFKKFGEIPNKDDALESLERKYICQEIINLHGGSFEIEIMDDDFIIYKSEIPIKAKVLLSNMKAPNLEEPNLHEVSV